MKENPQLNHNSEVALYCMASFMPDMSVLESICKLHTQAVLDVV